MNGLGFTPVGAIFDFDDTLLDNEYDDYGSGNHERLRLAAVQEVGRLHGIDSLINATAQQSVEAFQTVKVTTFSYALWNMLCMLQLRHNPDEPDFDDELMVEITAKKDALYNQLLTAQAKEVSGSSNFVREMHALTGGRIAIGSSGKLRDIQTYLTAKGLKALLPDHRIVSYESVKNAKPDPEVFDKAFRSLGLDDTQRSKVCVFEDDPRGIMAAKAAGLYACAITTCYTKDALLSAMVPPDCVASSYNEFEQLLGLK